jgi:hypothetical protein
MAALGAWVVAILPAILLPSPWLLAALFGVAAAGVVAVMLLITHLLHRRWCAAASIGLAGAAFAGATLGAARFHDQWRWHLLRPYYVAQIAASPTGPDGIHGVSWDGGNGWDVRLEYHASEADARAWQRKQQEWIGSCKRWLIEIEPHYFLNGFSC